MGSVDAILPIAFTGFNRGMESLGKAPPTLDITEKLITYSGPECSVDLETLRSFDGKPVRVSQSAEPGVPGLCAVPVSRIPVRERQPSIQLLRHPRVQFDHGRGGNPVAHSTVKRGSATTRLGTPRRRG